MLSLHGVPVYQTATRTVLGPDVHSPLDPDETVYFIDQDGAHFTDASTTWAMHSLSMGLVNDQTGQEPVCWLRSERASAYPAFPLASDIATDRATYFRMDRVTFSSTESKPARASRYTHVKLWLKDAQTPDTPGLTIVLQLRSGMRCQRPKWACLPLKWVESNHPNTGSGFAVDHETDAPLQACAVYDVHYTGCPGTFGATVTFSIRGSVDTTRRAAYFASRGLLTPDGQRVIGWQPANTD